MKTCQNCQTVCERDDVFCRHCGHTRFDLKKIGTKIQSANLVIRIEVECPVGDKKKIRDQILKEKKFPDQSVIKIEDIEKKFSNYRYVDIKINPYICNHCRQVVSPSEQGVCSNCLEAAWRKRKVTWYGDDGWDGWTSDQEPKKSDREHIKWHAEEQFND